MAERVQNKVSLMVECSTNNERCFRSLVSLRQLAEHTDDTPENLITNFYLLDNSSAEYALKNSTGPTIRIYEPERLLMPNASLDEIKAKLKSDDVAVPHEWAIKVIGFKQAGVHKVLAELVEDDNYPEKILDPGPINIYLNKNKKTFVLVALDSNGDLLYPEFIT